MHYNFPFTLLALPLYNVNEAENGCYFLQIFLLQQQQSFILIFIIKGCYKIPRKNAKNRIEIYENRWFNYRI